MQTRQRTSLILAIISVVLAVMSISNVVPRIRLVEAILLFATAFGAGAGFAATAAGIRSGSST